MSGRIDELNTWLQEETGLEDFRMEPASEDASFRRYFRVYAGESSRIVMDAPPDKESCDEFIEIARRLRKAGVNAPEILQHDQKRGFLLLGDLGSRQYLQIIDNNNADELYRDAINALLRMQSRCETRGLPPYDEALLRSEMMLFNDWLVERHIGYSFSKDELQTFEELHELLVAAALEQPRVFVHRDYHSRNLMYVAGNNPGVLDFQDAVAGPVTYDIVSLLKDCYIKWPRENIDSWLDRFVNGSPVLEPGTSSEKIRRWFDLMGVQRHLKASGIFCRLYHRDGKIGYLKDIPRTLGYIIDLRPDYPELEPLCQFIESVVLAELEQVAG